MACGGRRLSLISGRTRQVSRRALNLVAGVTGLPRSLASALANQLGIMTRRRKRYRRRKSRGHRDPLNNVLTVAKGTWRYGLAGDVGVGGGRWRSGAL